jgi:hypothetical protein
MPNVKAQMPKGEIQMTNEKKENPEEGLKCSSTREREAAWPQDTLRQDGGLFGLQFNGADLQYIGGDRRKNRPGPIFGSLSLANPWVFEKSSSTFPRSPDTMP